MSIPNLLAITRLILTPIVMVLILQAGDSMPMRITATVLFTIAALTDFSAVGIEDSKLKINVSGRTFLGHQHLVKSDACVPVPQALDNTFRQLEWIAGGIDDNKVVAQRLHLSELK